MMLLQCRILLLTVLLQSFAAAADDGDAEFFQKRVLPMMEATCVKCHDPEDSKGDVPFMEVEKVDGIAAMRGVWRSVAAQLRNRTMPPPGKKQPSEEERIAVGEWLDAYLRKSALVMPPHAGRVVPRRLNRLDYDLTVQDLCGVDLDFKTTLPMETGGGEGFDNNGDTLYLPPILMERYLEAAQLIVDAAIASPPVDQRLPGASGLVSIHVDADYQISAEIQKAAEPGELTFSVDGVEAEKTRKTGVQLRLGRGDHFIEVAGAKITALQVTQKPLEIGDEQRAAHQRLLGLKPGEAPPADARKFARERLRKLLRQAFRRPVAAAEVDKFMALYDRAAKRDDPFEERLKLTLKGVLVSPDFLFRIEKKTAAGLQKLGDHELAVRLSYFLWSRPPDAELAKLADAGQLSDDATLATQVDRLIDDPRSLTYARAFVSQWLGTKDVGGRVAPVHNTKDLGYTDEVAADLREEGVRYYHHLLLENRSVFELVDSDYALLNKRLADYYKIDAGGLPADGGFQKISLPDRSRGGILGMGAVHALTSHENQTSAVLRGAWVFDTLLGSPVPPPPADVPSLKKSRQKERSEREALEAHRQDSSCMACHRMIDPIGFGLDNFDRLGRWREKIEGQNIDASGQLPTGEKFDGPAEMKKILLATQGDLILRQLIRKQLGYALGRNLDPEDDGSIEQIVTDLEKNRHGARQLIHSIVRSTPFGFRG